MASVALSELQRPHPLVPEHPRVELARAAGAVRELPPADLRALLGRGAAGRRPLSSRLFPMGGRILPPHASSARVASACLRMGGAGLLARLLRTDSRLVHRSRPLLSSRPRDDWRHAAGRADQFRRAGVSRRDAAADGALLVFGRPGGGVPRPVGAELAGDEGVQEGGDGFRRREVARRDRRVLRSGRSGPLWAASSSCAARRSSGG